MPALPRSACRGRLKGTLKGQILEFDRRILTWHRSNATSQRLDAIPEPARFGSLDRRNEVCRFPLMKQRLAARGLCRLEPRSREKEV